MKCNLWTVIIGSVILASVTINVTECNAGVHGRVWCKRRLCWDYKHGSWCDGYATEINISQALSTYSRTGYTFTTVSVYINTMKTTFLFQFWHLTSFLQITSSQVNKEKLLIGSFSYFSMFMFIHTVWKLGKSKKFNRKLSSLYCSDCIIE